VTSYAFAENIVLPPGWRMPYKSELNDDWRKNNPSKYSVVRADFNGDGLEDSAILLVSRRYREIGLFVFLSNKNGAYKTYQLDAVKDEKFLQIIGVTTVLPGVYRTACGKGYWACKKDESSDVLIKHSAISYFKIESAASYFYWDERSGNFKRVWISD
jgi:hypothetical protein